MITTADNGRCKTGSVSGCSILLLVLVAIACVVILTGGSGVLLTSGEGAMRVLLVLALTVAARRLGNTRQSGMLVQADEARRQAEAAEQQSAEHRFLELQQKAQEEQEK